MNPTMKKFGYPDSLIREYGHWVVLLRPQQVTLGALVLVCKDDAESLSAISAAAFAELKEITTAIEANLGDCFAYDKINYLMLMMVDRDVHFHVLPRYAGPRLFDQVEFHDPAWPGPPELSRVNATGGSLQHSIRQVLQQAFARQRPVRAGGEITP